MSVVQMSEPSLSFINKYHFRLCAAKRHGFMSWNCHPSTLIARVLTFPLTSFVYHGAVTSISGETVKLFWWQVKVAA